MTDDKIIDFEAARDRRDLDEMDGDQARWDDACCRLVEVAASSELSDVAMISAALSALLEVLEASDMSRRDAKTQITRSLKIFRE